MSALHSKRGMIFVANAHRDDRKRLIVREDKIAGVAREIAGRFGPEVRRALIKLEYNGATVLEQLILRPKNFIGG